jgi:hypothetical protein
MLLDGTPQEVLNLLHASSGIESGRFVNIASMRA